LNLLDGYKYMMRGAIVIPAGSGKTTLSNAYKNMYDIDSFHSNEDTVNLNNLYKELSITNDWGKYNDYEVSLLKVKISHLPIPFIVLLHCKEKADLLDLTYLGSCKISKPIMEEIATKRGKTDKLREEMTRYNWTNTHATIFETYEEIHTHIIHLCETHNISLHHSPIIYGTERDTRLP
jgi:hypothetical protein